MVTATKVIDDGAILIEGGRISRVGQRGDFALPAAGMLDADGCYLLPGLVDVHSDNIEQQLNPRPRVTFPHVLAFLEADRLFAGCGITTIFHAIALKDDDDRSVATARALLNTIVCHRGGGRIRHEVHLRCELSQEASVVAALNFLTTSPAAIVALMDHTPGYGKYRDPAWMEQHSQRKAFAAGSAPPAVDKARLARHAERAATVVAAGRRRGATLFSHDDFAPEQVMAQARLGVTVSEFPVDAATALRAKALGLAVCMGAPNVVRGRSHGGSMPAADAVLLGVVDMLCSDYHPPSLVQAVFQLVRDGILSLPDAAALASSGPAAAVGLRERGEIRAGAVADLVLVGERLGLPAVSHTIVDGAIVATG